MVLDAPCGRLSVRPPDGYIAEIVRNGDVEALQQIEQLLHISPHNRQLCTDGDALNNVLTQLQGVHDATHSALVLRIATHMGAHRFTVHNMRHVLMLITRFLQAEAAQGEATTVAVERAMLDILQLTADILSTSAAPQLPAFWDMSLGIMGATGFDLAPDRLVFLVNKGAFSFSCWVRLETLGAQPIAIFGVVDALGAGIQLQLQRTGTGLAQVAIMVTAPRVSSASKLLNRFSSGLAHSNSGTGAVELSVSTNAFEGSALVRCGSWHFLTISCRRRAILGLGSVGRDEAQLCIDGTRVLRAHSFRYPTLTTERAVHGRAAVGAPTIIGATAASLRGQLGPFVLFDTAFGAAEFEACYDAACMGRALFEWPHVLAAWHPLLTDRSAGMYVLAGLWNPLRPQNIRVAEMLARTKRAWRCKGSQD